ncbi:radical SAM protein [bacterium]|nr:radical SAM protein [bacterium]MCI0605079.1 radical SAM protein [bacterium]
MVKLQKYISKIHPWFANMANALPLHPKQPTPDLYTYHFSDKNGYFRRVHLRIEQDGRGVMFLDVTDAIQLNQTAALIAGWALDGMPEKTAMKRLKAAYAGHEQIARDVSGIYRFIQHVTQESGCPTCGIDFLERKALFSTRANAPYKADIALTYGCNNACSHCYNATSHLGMASLALVDWKKVFVLLKQKGVPHIIFTGGEATLHPDLPELIQFVDQQGQIAGLNSNGRRFSHLSFVRTLKQAGLNHLQITLASNQARVHDEINGVSAFSQTVKGIENALAGGIHTITNTTIMQKNRDHVEEIIDFIYALGIRTFAMNGMIYSGGGYCDPNAIPEEELPAVLIRIRDRALERGMKFLWYTPTEYCRMNPVELEIGAKRCNAAEYSICIEPNGDVLPCQSFYVSAGNILRDPWEKIWDGELFRSFRDRELDPKWAGLPEKCWECPDLPLCGGGCRIEREARDGVLLHHEGGCESESPARPSFIPIEQIQHIGKRAAGRGAGVR